MRSHRINSHLVAAGFVLSAAAFTPQQAASAPWGRPIDTGGGIGDRVREILASRGARHEIAGDCMSACTMWLGARKACVQPDAVLWFHGATGGRAAYGGGGDRSETGNQALLAFYPPAVRRVVVTNGWLDSSTLRPLTAAQLVRLGVPACRR